MANNPQDTKNKKMNSQKSFRPTVFVWEMLTLSWRESVSRTALKASEPNLRFPAIFSENLRFLLESLRFPAPSQCLNLQEKGWVCENPWFSVNLCFGLSLSPYKSVPSAPWVCLWLSAINGWNFRKSAAYQVRLGCSSKRVLAQSTMGESASEHPKNLLRLFPWRRW